MSPKNSRVKGKRPPVHPDIKRRLGYDERISDRDFLKSWRERSTQVCKPCWELKYCPYGPFVEQSPILPGLRREAISHNDYLKRCLASGTLGDVGPLPDETRDRYKRLLKLARTDSAAFAELMLSRMAGEDHLKESLSSDAGLGPIEEYYAPPDLDNSRPPELTPEESGRIDLETARMRSALKSGIDDNRRPLDEVRRSWFEKQVNSFDESDYPETIPQEVLDAECSVFGHICPVVFVGEPLTETEEARRKGRYIPFRVKIRVVRRDNYTCQRCGRHLKDNEVEFDHKIPIARGGSSEEHNIELTCFECNRAKSSRVDL
ncbi:MAG TPA: HNH endonuclease signature motif containing protein [Thermoanaerobaculia bacterium]|nr:HNH endonuclease signature motif containing protein [Thermoanaerobaculia bacterium]